MAEPVICPHCSYERQSYDITTPDWQCPKCKRGYPKHLSHRDGQPKGLERPISSKYEAFQRYLWFAIGVLACLWLLGRWQRGKVSASSMLPALQQEPQQTATQEKPFQFTYRKRTYDVKPVANYKLWGYVVSHNDISSFSDIYHTKDSVDTKDLCVIWGPNVKDNQFHKVSFRSGSWTCYFRYPGGVRFSKSHLSNNHLVTDDAAVRRLISKVRVGDQVKFEGMLVNYKDSRRKYNWRKSSTTRKDTGNTACEVVFVRNLEILKRGTPFWYFLASVSFWLLVLAGLGKFAAFALESKFPPDEE